MPGSRASSGWPASTAAMRRRSEVRAISAGSGSPPRRAPSSRAILLRAAPAGAPRQRGSVRARSSAQRAVSPVRGWRAARLWGGASSASAVRSATARTPSATSATSRAPSRRSCSVVRWSASCPPGAGRPGAWPSARIRRSLDSDDVRRDATASGGTRPRAHRRPGAPRPHLRPAGAGGGTSDFPVRRRAGRGPRGMWADAAERGPRRQPARPAARTAPSSQHASVSALPGAPVTVTGSAARRQPRPVVTVSTERTAPVTSLPPCTQ